LCVEDFGGKYYSDADAQHLLDALGANNRYTTDWTRVSYYALIVEWKYLAGYVDISVPCDLQKSLKNTSQTASLTSILAHSHIPIQYGTKNHDNI